MGEKRTAEYKNMKSKTIKYTHIMAVKSSTLDVVCHDKRFARSQFSGTPFLFLNLSDFVDFMVDDILLAMILAGQGLSPGPY